MVAGSFYAGVDAEECNVGAEAEVEGVAELGDVGAGVVAEDKVGGGGWFGEDEDVFELGGGGCGDGGLEAVGVGVGVCVGDLGGGGGGG